MQFVLNPNARAAWQLVGGQVPVVTLDGVFKNPQQVRQDALRLSYTRASTGYPGRIADIPPSLSLEQFRQNVLAFVNKQYLTRVPPIHLENGPIRQFSRVYPDLALTDFHPDELKPSQRKPHIDPNPVFALVYLNEQPRGGTLFFEKAKTAFGTRSEGYISADDPEFKCIGRIDGLFNRLAVYPGFVLHSGEIDPSWIGTDQRFTSPRLTLRLAFFP